MAKNFKNETRIRISKWFSVQCMRACLSHICGVFRIHHDNDEERDKKKCYNGTERRIIDRKGLDEQHQKLIMNWRPAQPSSSVELWWFMPSSNDHQVALPSFWDLLRDLSSSSKHRPYPLRFTELHRYLSRTSELCQNQPKSAEFSSFAEFHWKSPNSVRTRSSPDLCRVTLNPDEFYRVCRVSPSAFHVSPNSTEKPPKYFCSKF